MKLVEDSNNEDEKIMSIYRRAIPLLDKSLQEPLETTRSEIDTISHALVAQLFKNEESDYSVTDLIQKRDAFKGKIIEALQKQLVSLFAQNTDVR